MTSQIVRRSIFSHTQVRKPEASNARMLRTSVVKSTHRSYQRKSKDIVQKYYSGKTEYLIPNVLKYKNYFST